MPSQLKSLPPTSQFEFFPSQKCARLFMTKTSFQYISHGCWYCVILHTELPNFKMNKVAVVVVTTLLYKWWWGYSVHFIGSGGGGGGEGWCDYRDQSVFALLRGRATTSQLLKNFKRLLIHIMEPYEMSNGIPESFNSIWCIAVFNHNENSKYRVETAIGPTIPSAYSYKPILQA